jgi:hypothetical protein
MRDLRDEVRRAERVLAAALGRDPDAPLGTLRFLVAEAAARLRTGCAGAGGPASAAPLAGDGWARAEPEGPADPGIAAGAAA